MGLNSGWPRPSEIAAVVQAAILLANGPSQVQDRFVPNISGQPVVA